MFTKWFSHFGVLLGSILAQKGDSFAGVLGIYFPRKISVSTNNKEPLLYSLVTGRFDDFCGS